MPTPVYPSSRFYAAGLAKGTTWGTAAATGAAKGALIIKDGGLALKQKYISNEDLDQIMIKGGTLGPVEAIDFDPEFAMRYDLGLLGSLIAALFVLRVDFGAVAGAARRDLPRSATPTASNGRTASPISSPSPSSGRAESGKSRALFLTNCRSKSAAVSSWRRSVSGETT